MIRRFSIWLCCAAVAAAVLPAGASAGTYDVTACFDDTVNNSWQPFQHTGFAEAGFQCPSKAPNGAWTEGMFARNTRGSSTAPYFSHARVSFLAPPGARIIEVRGFTKLNGTGGWEAGLHDEPANRWVMCCSTLNTWQPFTVRLSTSHIAALAMCAAPSGCSRDGFHGSVGLRDVTVTVADDGAPSVAIRGGGLVARGWRHLLQDLVIDATDPVGVRGTTVSIDGTELGYSARACDFSRTAPCANGHEQQWIETRAFADGRHTLRVEAVDTAGNAHTIERPIFLDNHAPVAPAGLSVDGGAGWTSRSSFTLRWTNPPQPRAPIARALVAICPAHSRDESSCTPSRSVGRVTNAVVSVPGAGQWRARVRLEDEAGNASRVNAAERILKVDDKPPAVSFQRPSADRPALVRVAARDDTSGLGVREILLRRRGSPAWINLPVSVQQSGFSTVIDDENLPDGRYQLRARAVDLAGNERSTDRLSDGKLAELALPLRIKTRLAVGRPTRVRARGAGGKRRYRVKLVASPRAGFGRTIPLRGRLTSPGANPLPGREVRVLEQTRLPSSPWRLIATVRTSRTGRFTFRALRGPSRTLRFRFGGSDTICGRTADVRLGVRAATTMRVSRGRVVNGEDVTFRGRLRGRPLPRPGKLIELQAYARGRWLTFGTTRANPRTGRWSYPYRFSATRGNVRYRFRARVPKEASYPYETGASRRIKVSVRGL